jgi:hypothetical protein
MTNQDGTKRERDSNIADYTWIIEVMGKVKLRELFGGYINEGSNVLWPGQKCACPWCPKEFASGSLNSHWNKGECGGKKMIFLRAMEEYAFEHPVEAKEQGRASKAKRKLLEVEEHVVAASKARIEGGAKAEVLITAASKVTIPVLTATAASTACAAPANRPLVAREVHFPATIPLSEDMASTALREAAEEAPAAKAPASTALPAKAPTTTATAPPTTAAPATAPPTTAPLTSAPPAMAHQTTSPRTTASPAAALGRTAPPIAAPPATALMTAPSVTAPQAKASQTIDTSMVTRAMATATVPLAKAPPAAATATVPQGTARQATPPATAPPTTAPRATDAPGTDAPKKDHLAKRPHRSAPTAPPATAPPATASQGTAPPATASQETAPPRTHPPAPATRSRRSARTAPPKAAPPAADQPATRPRRSTRTALPSKAASVMAPLASAAATDVGAGVQTRTQVAKAAAPTVYESGGDEHGGGGRTVGGKAGGEGEYRLGISE